MEIEKSVLTKAVSELKNLFGERLRKVILFGSLARGDFDGESDVDIMVLADIEREKISKYRPQVVQISSDIGIDNNIYVSIMLDSADFFSAKQGVSDFYRNVTREGRVLYSV
jgi:predicted nucleotidyltransferase